MKLFLTTLCLMVTTLSLWSAPFIPKFTDITNSVNALSLLRANTNDFAETLRDYADDTTNNPAIQRTNVNQTVYGTRDFRAQVTASGRLLLTQQGATTNVLTSTNTIDMALDSQLIVAVGTVTISNCANTVVGELCKSALLVVASGADRTLRIPDWVLTTDGLRTWNVTNSTRGMLYIETYGNLYTNASYSPLF
jgi:hypothetical protein